MKILQIIKIIKIMAKFLLISLLVLGLGLYSGCGSDGTGTGGAGGAAGPPEGATAANPSEGFYVKISNPPVSNPDGSSWTNAFGDLQSAINAAAAKDSTKKTVYVAQGTYKPQGHPNGGTGDRAKHFALKNGVTVIGGYPGLKDNEYNDVDPSKTILSGDLGDNDTANMDENKDDNVYHVFYHPEAAALAKTAKLENVTITKGNADGTSGIDQRGGGMHNNGSSPTLNGVTFTNNTANNGGGIYNQGSSPTLNNVNFTSNKATLFSGGGMFNNGSSPTLNGVTFTNNTATNNGGGMYNGASSSPTLNGVTFTNNTATNNGGGMANFNSSPNLTKVTFTSNTAANGGGMYNSGTSNPTLTNTCTFTGNMATINIATRADGKGGAIYNNKSSTITGLDYAQDDKGNKIKDKGTDNGKTNGYYKEPATQP